MKISSNSSINTFTFLLKCQPQTGQKGKEATSVRMPLTADPDVLYIAKSVQAVTLSVTLSVTLAVTLAATLAMTLAMTLAVIAQSARMPLTVDPDVLNMEKSTKAVREENKRKKKYIIFDFEVFLRAVPGCCPRLLSQESVDSVSACILTGLLRWVRIWCAREVGAGA